MLASDWTLKTKRNVGGDFVKFLPVFPSYY